MRKPLFDVQYLAMMESIRMISRRRLIQSMGIAGAVAFGNTSAMAQFGALDGAANGLIGNTGSDVSAQLLDLLFRASALQQPLFLPAGDYLVGNISLPPNTLIVGMRGQTNLVAIKDGPILSGQGVQNVSIENLTFIGTGSASSSEGFGLVDMVNCNAININGCAFERSASTGLSLYGCAGTVEKNSFKNIANAAIASTDATDVSITNNSIDGCGNNGILVWRNDNSHDGSIVMGNRIKNIDWRSGGNGQNGNGINVFRAADVIVSNNVITDCAFSAIRANGSVNCQIIGNNCRNLSEVAIFSEFDFSGSIVAQNIVDGAAQGISITNWNDGGHLAVCANNIVRNIWKTSPNNPDTIPVGIGVEADIVVDGNVIENVPGTGIAAGWGPYMRNISITDNLIREVDYGIYVSLADGIGAAQVKDNQIDSPRLAAIVGGRWDDIIEMNLQKAADKYPMISVSGN
ncbi:MAG: putative secreted repeat protein (TIGR03808 family) [Maritalea sp.]